MLREGAANRQEGGGTVPSVKILWGSNPENADTTKYEFPTEKELDAFLTGVEAAIGWMDYQIPESE